MLKKDSKNETRYYLKKRIVLTRMVGIELSLALVVSQFPVESANGLHALPPVLRKRFGPRGKGVADDPFVEFMS